MKKTLYDILEVSQSASADAIRAAYERLSAQLRRAITADEPDAVVRLTAVKQAFDVLSNPDRRKRYDASLVARVEPVTAATGPIRPAARLYDEFGQRERSPLQWLIGGAILLAVVASAYAAYQTHKSKEAALVKERIELERQRLEAARELEQQRVDLQRRREEQQQALQRENATRASQAQEDAQRQMRDSQYNAQLRQKQMDEQRVAREQQIARDRARLEAEQRARKERELLRSICIERYRRPDC